MQIVLKDYKTEIIKIKDHMQTEQIILKDVRIELIELGTQGIAGPMGPRGNEYPYQAGIGGVSKGRIGMIDVQDTIQHANAYEPTHQGRVVGLITEGGAEGQEVAVITGGEFLDDSWNLTPATIYYLVAGGEISTNPPTSGFVQKVGVSKSAKILVVGFGEPVKIV